MNKIRLIYDCEHKQECRVRKKYPDLCYLNMKENERKSLGDSCPIFEEYNRIPEEVHDIVCPSGLLRKIISGKVSGRRL